jgi:hypothetical protein
MSSTHQSNTEIKRVNTSTQSPTLQHGTGKALDAQIIEGEILLKSAKQSDKKFSCAKFKRLPKEHKRLTFVCNSLDWDEVTSTFSFVSFLSLSFELKSMAASSPGGCSWPGGCASEI